VLRGHDVRAFVFYNSFNSWGWLDYSEPAIKKSLEIFAGDIRDPHGMKQAMKGCDLVFHLAALIAIPYSYQRALKISLDYRFYDFVKFFKKRR